MDKPYRIRRVIPDFGKPHWALSVPWWRRLDCIIICDPAAVRLANKLYRNLLWRLKMAKSKGKTKPMPMPGKGKKGC
jgi:hypothetical protein